MKPDTRTGRGNRASWQYALLIIALLTLASLASLSVVLFLDWHPSLRAHQEALSILNLMLLLLFMGFLFLAGALGLWGVNTVAEREGQRKVGRVVDAMDFVSDALIVLDRQGVVVGCNPSARMLCGKEKPEQMPAADLFPALSDQDVGVLLDISRPREVERPYRDGGDVRMLRFRSQPSEGMHLLVVSDVTELKLQELQKRQAAQLQLVGRIARGVAHDFNNVLCAISGHAALLELPEVRNKVDNQSITAIKQEAERGAMLARQLLELSKASPRGPSCEDLASALRSAAELLRATLPESRRVDVDTATGIGAVPLTTRQIEKLLVSLGILVSEAAEPRSPIRIRAGRAGEGFAADVGDPYAAVMLVDTEFADSGRAASLPAAGAVDEGGVILAVLQTLVEEVGGRVDSDSHNRTRPRWFRVALPKADAGSAGQSDFAGIPDDLKQYVGRWSVLLACQTPSRVGDLQQRLSSLRMRVDTAGDLVSALEKIETQKGYTGIVFDESLLGMSADGLLQAIRKLQPGAGLVVLGDLEDLIPAGLRNSIVLTPPGVPAETILKSLLRARELAQAAGREAAAVTPAE